MHCPTCGGEFEKVSVVGFDDSLRCVKCGGLWVANWVVNNVADGKTIQVAKSNKLVQERNGSLTCPIDGNRLSGVSEESVPAGVRVLKCNACGGWWFEGDDIFEFAQAAFVKHEYLLRWKKKDVISLAWPAFALVLMLGGVVGGVYLVRSQQQVTTIASFGIYDLFIVNMGNNEVEIRFKSGQVIEKIGYRISGDINWSYVEVTKNNNEYVVVFTGLQAGDYEFQIGDIVRKVQLY